MSLTQRAREFKHAGWLLRRATSRTCRDACARARDVTLHIGDRVSPPRYRDGAFPDSFVDLVPKSTSTVDIGPIPRRVFCLWTGDNPITPNRQAALEDLRARNREVTVITITPDNLPEWIVPDAPLHPAYLQLSFVHRSDYLRSYLMHHHGGAYVDIKRDIGDLGPSFAALESRPDKWLLGYRERGADHVSDEPGTIYKAMRRHHGLMVGNCGFIARPRTPLTQEWHAEVERRMDSFAPALASAPGGVWGDLEGYPVRWGALQGATFQPACFKYIERLLIDNRIRPSFKGYR